MLKYSVPGGKSDISGARIFYLILQKISQESNYKQDSENKELLAVKRSLIFYISTYIILLLFTFLVINELREYDGYSTKVLSYYGSRGQEVRDIQARLKNWGYYDGPVDGIYGQKTYEAVKKFQKKNGLKVDGIAGPETLAAIGLPTGRPASYSADRDVNLLAHVIYGEARGEPYIGQVAIGAVVLNRVRDPRFPSTIAGVIYQPGAFTAVSDGQINLTPNETAYKAARDALNGWDPTYGCLYYYNPATATSKWIWSLKVKLRIGKHNFAVG